MRRSQRISSGSGGGTGGRGNAPPLVRVVKRGSAVFDNPAEFEDEDDDVEGDDDGQRGSDSEEEGAPNRKKGRVHMNDRNVLNMSDNFAGYNSVKVPPKGK